jgi:hypothetical protein
MNENAAAAKKDGTISKKAYILFMHKKTKRTQVI